MDACSTDFAHIRAATLPPSHIRPRARATYPKEAWNEDDERKECGTKDDGHERSRCQKPGGIVLSAILWGFGLYEYENVDSYQDRLLLLLDKHTKMTLYIILRKR